MLSVASAHVTSHDSIATMKRFLISASARQSEGSTSECCEVQSKRPCIEQGKSTGKSKTQGYKKNLKFNVEWKLKWRWMEFDESKGGMVCTVCMKHGKPPVQARGAWVSRAINNWVKATELLSKHDKSEWHLAALEAQGMAESAMQTGDIVDMIVASSNEQKKRNRELVKKLVRSVYFLVRHRIPHTTTFDDLIALQIDNGDELLKLHEACPSNATYLSTTSTAGFIKSISHLIENNLLARLKASPFYSIMADESTDVSSKEELSVCGRWIENGKAAEHFLGIIHARGVTAGALTQYLLDFLQNRGISTQKLRGLGFDGASTMSGARTGVQIRMRYHSPSALYVHCRCHQLQLAAVAAAKEHNEVNRVFGTLLTMWKAFHYSLKKAEKLADIQAVLNAPEIKVTKPSDTRWLARERCIHAVRRTLPALVSTFETIYEDGGDAEAYGISKILRTYKFVACLYMLSDVLHVVAKLQGSLQSKELDLATVPVMVEGTISRLRELKNYPESSTWFKDHVAVFAETCQPTLTVSEADKESFLSRIYRPYIQSVIDHISNRLKSSDVFSAFSVFDPVHLPQSEESLSSYGMEKLRTLTNFYGSVQRVSFDGKMGLSTPDIVSEEAEAEWKIFRRILFRQYHSEGLQKVVANLLENSTLKAGFPNLSCLAAILSFNHCNSGEKFQ